MDGVSGLLKVVRGFVRVRFIVSLVCSNINQLYFQQDGSSKFMVVSNWGLSHRCF